jgi:hypothetical protein
MAPVAIHHEALARGVPTMKNQDPTEKDVKIVTGSQDVATPKPDKRTTKELTDEQIAGVVGGDSGGDRPSIIAII